jgi:tetratricopeptide (TPR) repeat protein
MADREHGSILNNLAQVDAELGLDEEARQRFEQAIALSDSLEAFYHRNYADFLAGRGEEGRAAEHYRQTLEREPDDLQAHQALMSILSRQRPEAIPEYLWFLIGRGQPLWAAEAALERLGEGATEPSQAYLTILAGSLAEQVYLPEEIRSAGAAEVLTVLSGRPGLAEGAREILRLHAGEDFDPASYRWWAERGEPDSGSGPSPRQVFRHLIRSLGEAQKRAERFDSAREYFRLAVLLTREESDLEAFRMMLSLPSVVEDVAVVDRLAEWNEQVVRETNPKQSDLYFYRHDLGLLYGFLKHWEGEGPASGIYQLSRATQIGGIGPPDGPRDTPTFDARLYSRLAAGYSDTGKPEQARRTLYALVDAYRSHGMSAEAEVLLAMLESGQGRRPLLDRRRDVFDDPPLQLRDFTTEPPSEPSNE